MKSIDKFFLSIEGLDNGLLGEGFFYQLSLNPPSLCLLLKEMVGSLSDKA